MEEKLVGMEGEHPHATKRLKTIMSEIARGFQHPDLSVCERTNIVAISGYRTRNGLDLGKIKSKNDLKFGKLDETSAFPFAGYLLLDPSMLNILGGRIVDPIGEGKILEGVLMEDEGYLEFSHEYSGPEPNTGSVRYTFLRQNDQEPWFGMYNSPKTPENPSERVIGPAKCILTSFDY